MEAEVAPNTLIGTWETILCTELIWTTLKHGDVLSFIITWYAMLCGYTWEACQFLKRSRGGVDWVTGGKVRGGNGTRGGMGKCGRDVK